METLETERRASAPSTRLSTQTSKAEQVVRQAISLQAVIGTRGAVEYLKAHAIQPP